MRANDSILGTSRLSLACAALLLPLVFSPGCSGSNGPAGPQGPPGGSNATNTNLRQGDTLPGLAFVITSISGGSAGGGNFRAGDTIKVHYTAKKTDGTDWDLSELASGRILVSGPTSNYQRVIAEQQDLLTASVAQTDGSFLYTFSTPIPDVYLAPLNDTPTFGSADGELTGQPLLDGTYTVGLYARWNYNLDGVAARLTNDATADFVVGAGAATPRAVVGQDNCNRCHDQLQAHGGTRRSVTLCLMCHTAGAEDMNDPNVLGGTPNVTIEFKVMIHRIHNGAHLPSVLGVSTNPDGSRNYAATPQPFQIVGYQNSINDFSDIGFPAWPGAQVAMPRDQGYSALSAGQKTQEDNIRKGVTACYLCHGDPDGAGPITAPAQGDFYKLHPSQAACYACHDDVIPGTPYTSNGLTMGAQANDTNCTQCHVDPGTPATVGIETAHLHPLLDPNFNVGLHLNISSVAEAGTNNGSGTIDPGEKIALTFTLTNDVGAAVDPTTLGNFTCLVSGPTSNYNVLVDATVPNAMVTGSPPYTVNVPQPVLVERVGMSTGALESFHTALTPMWNVSGVTTTVQVRTATAGGNSTLTAAAAAPVNYIDVADATNFARNDYIVVDDGTANEEYAKIQTVDGLRLWFGSNGSTTYPYGMLKSHSVGATVKEVTLVTKALTTDYTLNPATGTITEVTEFGNGNVVLCSYTTDFVMPAVFPMTIDDTPDQDERTGQWTGKPIVDGTYSVSLWTSKTTNLVANGETNAYRWANDSSTTDFLVGSATTIEPYALISSPANCNVCHQDVGFHGYGRRGFMTCIMCHGGAGAEDLPNYVAPNAPHNGNMTIDYRQMLHAVHMGSDLTYPTTSFYIVGSGSAAYPNNYGVTTFETIGFPAMPSGVRNCAKCHGADSTAWNFPSDRSYPAGQTLPFKGWGLVCGACHDADDAQAHISIMTSTDGVESCDLCHGTDGQWAVARMHKVY